MKKVESNDMRGTVTDGIDETAMSSYDLTISPASPGYTFILFASYLSGLAFVVWVQASGMCTYWIIRACS